MSKVDPRHERGRDQEIQDLNSAYGELELEKMDKEDAGEDTSQIEVQQQQILQKIEDIRDQSRSKSDNS